MVATVCRWDDNAKVAKLVTRLKGQAYIFFRWCTSQQCRDYQSTVAALKAVQSRLFNERKKGPKETVDSYAQSLGSLFYKAYPHSEQGTSEAEAMGQCAFAYQWVLQVTLVV